MMRKIGLTGLIFGLLSAMAYGQISPFADQFLSNPFSVNPALAGTSRYSPLYLSYRQDWLGIAGSPKFQSITYHQSILEKRQRFNPRGFLNRGDNSFGKVGLGGGVFNVSAGAVNQIGLHMDYAYHVYLDQGRLSFGLAPMYHQFIINKSKLIPPDGSTPDPVLDNSAREVIHFLDVNAGVHFFGEHLTTGMSVVQLFNSGAWFGDLSFDTMEDTFKNYWLNRSIYAYGSYRISLGDDVVLEPGIFGRYAASTGFGFQGNLMIILMRDYQMGILYRYREAVGFYAGIRVGPVIFRYQFESPVGSAIPGRFVTNQVGAGYLLED